MLSIILHYLSDVEYLIYNQDLILIEITSRSSNHRTHLNKREYNFG